MKLYQPIFAIYHMRGNQAIIREIQWVGLKDDVRGHCSNFLYILCAIFFYLKLKFNLSHSLVSSH